MKLVARLMTYLIVVLSVSVYGQSNIGIMSSTGDVFQLAIDGKVLSDNPDSTFKIFNIESGSHQLAVTLDSSTATKPVYLEKGTEHWFEVRHDSINTKIKFYNTFPVTQSDTVSKGRTLIYNKSATQSGLTFTNSAADMHVTGTSMEPGNVNSDVLTDSHSTNLDSPLDTNMVMDSVYMDSIAKLDFSVTYKGARGCEAPDKGISDLIDDLEDEEFNSRRLKKAKSNLQGRCISTAQVGSVLELFEFEDHRLEFISVVKSSIFDLDNLKELGEYFELSRNLEKFDEIISQNE